MARLRISDIEESDLRFLSLDQADGISDKDHAEQSKHKKVRGHHGMNYPFGWVSYKLWLKHKHCSNGIVPAGQEQRANRPVNEKHCTPSPILSFPPAPPLRGLSLPQGPRVPRFGV